MSDDVPRVQDEQEGSRFGPPPKTSISMELLRENAKKRPNFKSASLARRSQSARVATSRPLRRRRRRSSSGSLASGSSSDSTALTSLATLSSRPCLRHSAGSAVSRSLDDLLSAVKPVVPYSQHNKSVKFYLPETPSSATAGSTAMLQSSYRVPFVPDYRNPATAAAAAAFATAFYYPATAAPYYRAPYCYLASTAVYTSSPFASTGDGQKVEKSSSERHEKLPA